MQDVILLPGLGDDVELIQKATNNWKKFGLNPMVFGMKWRDEESFKMKLQRLCNLVDKRPKNDSKLSVVGCSAGGGAALNLFIERPTLIKNAVNVCGRLRNGDYKGFRSMGVRAKSSKSFRESVKLFEGRERLLTHNQRERIMTIHSLFGDELVPASTAILEGAHNITIPVPEHNFSIYMALSLFSKPLISFLKN